MLTHIAVSLTSFLLVVFVVVLAIRRRAQLHSPWSRPILLGLVAGLLLPAGLSVTVALRLPFDQILQGPPPVPEPTLRVFVVAFSLLFLVLRALYLIIQVPLARLLRVGERDPLPVLYGAERGLPGRWLPALAIGVVFGLVSAWALKVLGVASAPELDRLRAALPAPGSLAFMLIVGASTIGAAIAEEVLFRGVIQGWLSSRRWCGPWLAILAASALWAALHMANTQPIAPKLIQVFVLGLVLGELTRRYDVETAIIAHAAQNVAALLLTAFVLGF